MTRPVITLLTDFGLQDGYVAAMKGVIMSIAPSATLVDISHLIAPHDIRSAAFVLYTTFAFFPPHTIHVAVVDPGVGTERRAIAVSTRSCFLVGPDNGLFSFILKKESGWKARILENSDFHRDPVSTTFHGRDIFAPSAAHLSLGAPFEALGPECSPAISDWAVPVHTKQGVEGELIHIDRFGNAITNVDRKTLEKSAPLESWKVLFSTASHAPVQHAPHVPIIGTYARTEPGSALALIGSSGFIEIAVNRGNAASQLCLRTGMKVLFSH